MRTSKTLYTLPIHYNSELRLPQTCLCRPLKLIDGVKDCLALHVRLPFSSKAEIMRGTENAHLEEAGRAMLFSDVSKSI